MSFIEPQYAAPLPDGWQPKPEEWAAEEKFDGHRIVVEIGGGTIVHQLFADDRGQTVNAWSRYGASRTLPPHVARTLACLPVGIYDGELCVPGGRSYGVTELVQQDKLVYIVFDILRSGQTDCRDMTYDNRRMILQTIFEHPVTRGFMLGASEQPDEPAVRLATSTTIASVEHMGKLRDTIWADDGEGLILKRRSSRYHSGKRPKDWLKIKQLRSKVMTVVGFAPSRGKINNRGPFACVLCKDEHNIVTPVKTLNDVELEKFMKEDPYKGVNNVPDGTGRIRAAHPAIGRKLRVEYQEQTPDGSYRHPRWDRWENE